MNLTQYFSCVFVANAAINPYLMYMYNIMNHTQYFSRVFVTTAVPVLDFVLYCHQPLPDVYM